VFNVCYFFLVFNFVNRRHFFPIVVAADVENSGIVIDRSASEHSVDATKIIDQRMRVELPQSVERRTIDVANTFERAQVETAQPVEIGISPTEPAEFMAHPDLEWLTSSSASKKRGSRMPTRTLNIDSSRF
jgi:hypothetical protein